jgi:hypothetical protein
LGKKQDPIFTITKPKRAGGVAQAIEPLPCIQPLIKKREREKRKRERVLGQPKDSVRDILSDQECSHKLK